MDQLSKPGYALVVVRGRMMAVAIEKPSSPAVDSNHRPISPISPAAFTTLPMESMILLAKDETMAKTTKPMK